MTGTGDFGTIEVGKRADLVLLENNPLEDVTNIKRIRGVIAAGRWYDKIQLEKMTAPRIPVTGAIQHVQGPDKHRYTYIDVVR